MPRNPVSDTKEEGVVIYRLDLPADICAPLAQEAERNERTLPGQIRFALKDWLANRSQSGEVAAACSSWVERHNARVSGSSGNP